MNGEPIVVLLSDGRTINLQNVATTTRFTTVERDRNIVSGASVQRYKSEEQIINFGDGKFNPDVETTGVDVFMNTGTLIVPIRDKNDIALFDGAWMSYCLYANRKQSVKLAQEILSADKYYPEEEPNNI